MHRPKREPWSLAQRQRDVAADYQRMVERLRYREEREWHEQRLKEAERLRGVPMITVGDPTSSPWSLTGVIAVPGNYTITFSSSPWFGTPVETKPPEPPASAYTRFMRKKQ